MEEMYFNKGYEVQINSNEHRNSKKKQSDFFKRLCELYDEAVLMKNLETHSFALTHGKEGNKIEHNTENRNKILAIFCNPCKLCFPNPNE